MPGLNGAEATRAVLGACPGRARRLPDRVGAASEIEELLAAGAVACLTKDEELRPARRRGRARRPRR